MKKLFLLSACVATLWLAQSCSSASKTTVKDTTATNATTAASTDYVPDNVFMERAAAGGMAEVELSNLALAKSTNNDVKSFATMMVADHSKANTELAAIATSKNVTLPTKPDA